jgi:cobalt/nickel transport system permease protein
MIPTFLLQKEAFDPKKEAVKVKLSFIDRTMKNVSAFVTASFSKYYTSHYKGMFQSLDPRVKVIFMLCFIVLVNLTHAVLSHFLLFLVILLFYILSRLKLINAYKKILMVGFVFGFLIFVPASLNIVTRGQVLFTLLKFSQEHHWWIYKIPKEISITYEGTIIVLTLTFKLINSVSLVLLVISTTTFENMIKSLSFFKIPGIFLLTLTMSYKYIFVFSRTVEEAYQALKMRWWNHGSVIEAENIVAGRVGYLFRKSWERYELVYQSMIARGFDGSVHFNYFDKLKITDYIFIVSFITLASSIALLNILYG